MSVQTPIVRCFVQPRPIIVMQPNCDLSIKLLFSVLLFADSAASSPTGPKKAFLMEIAHHGFRVKTSSGSILNKSQKKTQIETREQYNDATDENGLKYKLPDIVDALNTGLGAFYLNCLIWSNVFLCLVLATFSTISSDSPMENFTQVFFSNQRPLCSKNSNLTLSWLFP